MGSLHGGRACKYVYIYMFFIILESSGLEFSIVPAGALNWLFFFHLIQSMKNNNCGKLLYLWLCLWDLDGAIVTVHTGGFPRWAQCGLGHGHCHCSEVFW